MVNRLTEQLPLRVVRAQQSSNDGDFAIYVRLARLRLGIKREELADQTGLDATFLAFLEKNRLQPGELTEEIRRKIELGLNVPYRRFFEQNERRFGKLRMYWDDSSAPM